MLDGLLRSAVNRLLRQEAWAAQRLQAHAGEIAELSLGDFRFRFHIDAQGLLDASPADRTPDVRIALPANALLHLGEGSDALTRLARVEGDARFAETLSELLAHLRPDLAAQLAPFLGNIMAQRVDQALHTTAGTLRDASGRLATNLRDYAVNERPVLVGRTMLESLSAEISRLRDDLARLDKRVERLGA